MMATLKLVNCQSLVCKSVMSSTVSFLRIFPPQTSHIFENHMRKGLIQIRVSSSFSGSQFKDSRVVQTCQKGRLHVKNNNGSSLTMYSVGCAHNYPFRNLSNQPLLRPEETNELNGSSSSLSIPQKFVEACPKRVQPYLRLSRIDKPIGTWLLFWPSTWGLTVASGGLPDITLLALFGAGAFIMRGAGCTVNDMWDRSIDPKVRRTSSRPLASRQLRMRHATAWLGGQLSIAFGILLTLNPSCFLISCGALGLVCLYPLAKRVTYWPQAVLGLTFNTGILIGYAAASSTKTGFFDIPYIDPACMSLYVSGILWTLIYDTIYAHQDLQDDTLLGLGSTARRFGDSTKLWLSAFSSLMITSLAATGVYADLSWPYYIGLSGVSAHLIWQIYTLDIKSAANCGARFNSNKHIGYIILASLLASYWLKNISDYDSLTNLSKSKLMIDNINNSKESLPKKVTNYTNLNSSGV